MKFMKGKSANGRPCIEILDYDYSSKGFLKVLTFFCEKHGTSVPVVLNGLDECFAHIKFGWFKKVSFHMDNFTFSIAFPSERERDLTLTLFNDLK